ncbi:EamA family transporter [uncultured Clostridium sp.]|jgi:drug/metabolite transporter (DMT)-like permease|uniref:EamA family transporter n=1 Tax=uncultured Clostridium sp. TaxID=59620 RepID=UPI00260EED8C|nr:EamA family transporter [uncultured Clostridium sp.]
MNKAYLLFPIMTLFGALGAFYFKKGTDTLTGILSLFTNWKIYVGGFFYVTAAILNIIALKYLPYSVVIPLTSITYVWTLIIARLALGEKITIKKIIGIVLILIGSIYVAI